VRNLLRALTPSPSPEYGRGEQEPTATPHGLRLQSSVVSVIYNLIDRRREDNAIQEQSPAATHPPPINKTVLAPSPPEPVEGWERAGVRERFMTFRDTPLPLHFLSSHSMNDTNPIITSSDEA
jgi:hypothetical protein